MWSLPLYILVGVVLTLIILKIVKVFKRKLKERRLRNYHKKVRKALERKKKSGRKLQPE